MEIKKENLKYLEKYSDINTLKKFVYPIMRKIGGITQADHDDFYSIANYNLFVCCCNYDSDKGVGFEQYFGSCLKKKFKTELTKRNAKRRICCKNVVPIDDEYMRCDIDNVYSYDNIEAYYMNLLDEKYVKMLNNLSELSSIILKMIISGYARKEIQEILIISDKDYNLCILEMQNNIP